MRPLNCYTLNRQPCKRPLLTYADKEGSYTVQLEAKETDDIEVFRECGVTYVLVWNEWWNYAGLEAFVGKSKIGELFLNHDSSLEAILGKKGFLLEPITIAKKMAESLSPTLNEGKYPLPGVRHRRRKR